MTSCITNHYGSSGSEPSIVSQTTVRSDNYLELDISEVPITYTIDISTHEGKNLLEGITLKEAEELVTREAIVHYQCAVIFQPEYKHLMRGKRVIKIQVYGFPARYKKAQSPSNSHRR